MKTGKLIQLLLCAAMVFPLFIVGCAQTQGSAAAPGTASVTETMAQVTATPLNIPPRVKKSTKVFAQGKYIPITSAQLSFASVGMISEVNFKVGDTVQKGQAIARISGSKKLQAAVVTAEMDLLLAQQDYNQLIKDADLAYAQALVRLAAAEKTLDSAEKKMDSKLYQHGNAYSIDVANADLRVLNEQVKYYEDIFNNIKDRPVEDPERAYALVELNKIRHKRDVAQANLSYLQAMPSKIEVNEAEANLELAKANVASAQAQCSVLKEGPDPDELELAKMKIANAEAQLAAARAALTDVELIAPFNGTIIQNNLKVGEMVDQTQMQVVIADKSVWGIETTDLTELNVVDIRVGNKASVTFDAVPNLELSGEVLSIDTFGTDNHGDVTYKALIKLDKTDERLRWNMTATVTFQP